MELSKKLKILDCTFRDGGFYNSWDFEDNIVNNYLNVINQSGVDIVEIGYRSVSIGEFYGMFKYSNDFHLKCLKEFKNVEFALMVDLKEFVNNGVLNEELFTKTFRKTNFSNISWVRIAILSNLVVHSLRALEILKMLGYKTTINLMQISLLDEKQIVEAIKNYGKDTLDIFYFADSFGSMFPQDIIKYINLIKNNFDGKIGFHAHDNMSLAFANSIEAINQDIDFVDSTIFGMGRGAGNLKTENILIYLKLIKRIERYNPNILLDFLEHYINPLKEEFKWGSNFNYMLSGLKNIHPMYSQKLEELGRYTSNKFIDILEKIPEQNKAKFSKKELDNAIVNAQKESVECSDPLSDDLTNKYFSDKTENNILVIGTGPSIKRYSKYIQEYIEKFSSFVVECNINPNLKYNSGFATLIHEIHLENIEADNLNRSIIFGNYSLYKSANLGLNNSFFRYKISRDVFNVSADHIVIPNEVVAMYALGIAILLKPKRILLAGFDGYKKNLDAASYVKQQEMDEFFLLFKEKTKESCIEYYSITPTTYTIPQTSIFYLLNQNE
ncbi:MAG: hypothetical protein ACYDA4_11375 [Ignavibacteriaceae bacterium]